MKILNSIALMLVFLASGCADKSAFSEKHTTGLVRGYDYTFGATTDLEFDFKAPRSGSYFLMGWDSQHRSENNLVFQLGFFANADEARTIGLNYWDDKPIKKLYRLDVIWSDGYNSELMETIIIEDNKSN